MDPVPELCILAAINFPASFPVENPAYTPAAVVLGIYRSSNIENVPLTASPAGIDMQIMTTPCSQYAPLLIHPSGNDNLSAIFTYPKSVFRYSIFKIFNKFLVNCGHNKNARRLPSVPSQLCCYAAYLRYAALTASRLYT